MDLLAQVTGCHTNEQVTSPYLKEACYYVWYAQVFESNNIKWKRSVLQISVPYINYNSAMWLPFNISKIEQESGEVVVGKPLSFR